MTLTESKSGGEIQERIFADHFSPVVVAGLAAIVGVTSLGSASARADSPLANHASPTSTSKPRDASLDDYKQHLTALTTLVEACAKGRDLKTCDPTLVGPDDRIPYALPGKAQPGNQCRQGLEFIPVPTHPFVSHAPVKGN